MSLLTHPDAGGDEEFFKTINRAYQKRWGARSVQRFRAGRGRESHE